MTGQPFKWAITDFFISCFFLCKHYILFECTRRISTGILMKKVVSAMHVDFKLHAAVLWYIRPSPFLPLLIKPTFLIVVRLPLYWTSATFLSSSGLGAFSGLQESWLCVLDGGDGYSYLQAQSWFGIACRLLTVMVVTVHWSFASKNIDVFMINFLVFFFDIEAN